MPKRMILMAVLVATFSGSAASGATGQTVGGDQPSATISGIDVNPCPEVSDAPSPSASGLVPRCQRYLRSMTMGSGLSPDSPTSNSTSTGRRSLLCRSATTL